MQQRLDRVADQGATGSVEQGGGQRQPADLVGGQADLDPDLVGVVDPVARTLTWASAGHLPPVARGSGRAATLDGPVGAPLGVGQRDHVDTVTPLDPGTLLVLFTDGLVEDRRRDLDVGLDLVRTLVDDADPDDLAGLAEVLLAHVAAVEEDESLEASLSREAIIGAVLRRYTVPAD